MDLQMLINTVKVASQSAGINISANNNLNQIKDIGNTFSVAKNINKINSIKGKARASIAQYPVLVSENLNPKLLPILNNALEVEYSSLVLLLLSNTSSFQSGDSSSVISQFHRTGLMEETFLHGVDSIHKLYEANKELLTPYEENLNMRSLNESYYTSSVMQYLTEKEGDEYRKIYHSSKEKYVKDQLRKDAEFELKEKQAKQKQSYSDRDYNFKKKQAKQSQANSDRDYNFKKNQAKQSQENLDRDYELKQKQYNDTIENNKRNQANLDRDYELKVNSDRRAEIKDRIGYAKSTMDMLNTGVNIATNISREIDRKRDRHMTKQEFEDNQAQKRASAGTAEVFTTMKDLNKVNDLHPTILNIEVNFREPGTNSVVKKKLSIGIKCVSHLIKSDDIQYYLTKASYKNSKFLRFIKWTTGEIKFWKDLVLNLDDAKLSAVQNSKTIGNKNYFNKLEFIAKTARQSKLAGSKEKSIPSAITTLIITKTDVENIKYKDGVNILANPEYLKKIFETYYLLNLLIVDESLDVVYSYDQFTNTINRQPFSSYEKNSKERVINANDLFKLSNL